MINLADKKNSHIVPKFLTRSLFLPTPPKTTLMARNNGTVEVKQDTPKEDHILCASCEKKIEVIETIMARKLSNLHDYKKYIGKFSTIVIGGAKYIECSDIDPFLFKLFIQSIVWRLSISKLNEFKSLNLKPSVEEEIRACLDNNLATTHTAFRHNLAKIKAIPEFHICLIKPENRTFPPGGIFSATSSDNAYMHLIMLVDFILFFITEDNFIDPAMTIYSNKCSSTVKVGLGDNQLWLEFNKLLFNMLARPSAGTN